MGIQLLECLPQRRHFAVRHEAGGIDVLVDEMLADLLPAAVVQGANVMEAAVDGTQHAADDVRKGHRPLHRELGSTSGRHNREGRLGAGGQEGAASQILHVQGEPVRRLVQVGAAGPLERFGHVHMTDAGQGAAQAGVVVGVVNQNLAGAVSVQGADEGHRILMMLQVPDPCGLAP